MGQEPGHGMCHFTEARGRFTDFLAKKIHVGVLERETRQVRYGILDMEQNLELNGEN